jgi:hypothetical protein
MKKALSFEGLFYLLTFLVNSQPTQTDFKIPRRPENAASVESVDMN